MILCEQKRKRRLSTWLTLVLLLSFLSPAFAKNEGEGPEPILDEFTAEELKDNDYILYFVNAGDPTPDTVEGIDKFGLYASVTEQEYKEDPVTGKIWGLETKTSATSVRDASNKVGSLRYYNGEQVRDKALVYSFELPEGEYDITFGFKNPWSGRSVCLMAEDQRLSDNDYPIGEYGAEKEVTYRKVPVADGSLNIRIQGPSAGSLSNYNDPLVNYIIIRLSVIIPVSDIEERIEQAKDEVSNTSYTPYSREILNAAIEEAEALVQSIENDEKDITKGETQEEIRQILDKLSLLITQLEVYEPYASFRPGAVWTDTNGAPIQAHGAGMLYDENTKKFYWYGEDKTHGYLPARGVRVYSSTDLYNWTDEGLALTAIESMDDFENDPLISKLYADRTEEEKAEILNDIGTDRVIERPKVIYNDTTKKYVMWMHNDGPTDYSDAMYAKAHAGCAISDSPTGPFVFRKSYRMDRAPKDAEYDGMPSQPGMARDMTLFKDDDGTAYLIYSSEENMTIYISKLNETYTDIIGWHKDGNEERDEEYKAEYGVDYVRVFPGAQREAPAMFKYQGKYYMITSGATGWAPNVGKYTVADDIFGEWKPLRDIAPGSNTTFDSQPTHVIPVDPKAGKFIYMGDRWKEGNLSDSRYVWLPIEFGMDDEIILKWYGEWTLEDLEGMGRITVNTELPDMVRLNESPQLPDILEVTKSDGTIINTPVTWEVDDTTFAKPGIIKLRGRLTELHNKGIEKEIYIVPYTDTLFVNCGRETTQDYIKMTSYMQDILVNQDVIDQKYNPEEGQTWGYVGDNTNTSGSDSDDMFASLRYLTSGDDIKYQFELNNGNYNVYVGLYDPWAQWSAGRRRADILINGETVHSDYVFTSSRDVLSFEKIDISEGMLELIVHRSRYAGASDSDPQISWIMIVSNKEVDKAELSNEIERIEGLDLDKELYTKDTWNRLELALTAAITVRDHGQATQSEVDNVVEELLNAIGGLKLIEDEDPEEVDKTALAAKIAGAEELDEELYTEESWAALESALAAAIAVNKNPEATQEEVDNAVADLQNAIAGLEEVEDEDPDDKVPGDDDKDDEEPTDEDKDPTGKDDKDTGPKTGDMGVGIYMLFALAALAIGVTVYMTRNRKQIKNKIS